MSMKRNIILAAGNGGKRLSMRQKPCTRWILMFSVNCQSSIPAGNSLIIHHLICTFPNLVLNVIFQYDITLILFWSRVINMVVSGKSRNFGDDRQYHFFPPLSPISKRCNSSSKDCIFHRGKIKPSTLFVLTSFPPCVFPNI